jgi:hypothetical protein
MTVVLAEIPRTRVATFIDYFNDVLAMPFRWIYTGRPLRA